MSNRRFLFFEFYTEVPKYEAETKSFLSEVLRDDKKSIKNFNITEFEQAVALAAARNYPYFEKVSTEDGIIKRKPYTRIDEEE